MAIARRDWLSALDNGRGDCYTRRVISQHNDHAEEETLADVKIEVRENGPNRVTGPIEIVDVSGANYSIPEGRWVSLCRCGHSAEKPFCDGAHRDAGFQADSAAR